MWLENKALNAQTAADINDTKTLYAIMKETTGNQRNLNVPIKSKDGNSLFTEKDKNERWTEYFKQLLNKPQPAGRLQRREEHTLPLDLNMKQISTNEVQQAIQSLKNNKSAGLDSIQAELIKQDGISLLTALTKLLNLCCEQASVPEDWRNGEIIKIPKIGDNQM